MHVCQSRSCHVCIRLGSMDACMDRSPDLGKVGLLHLVVINCILLVAE
jgi:hypothetical protein